MRKVSTAVFPELPFARQDRTQEELENDPKLSKEAISAVAVANGLYANGVDRILTMHMHSLKLYDMFENIYQRPGKDVIYDISPHPILAHYLMTKSSLDLSDGGANIGFVSPDKNAQRLVDDVMQLMPLPNAIHIKFDKTWLRSLEITWNDLPVKNYMIRTWNLLLSHVQKINKF